MKKQLKIFAVCCIIAIIITIFPTYFMTFFTYFIKMLIYAIYAYLLFCIINGFMMLLYPFIISSRINRIKNLNERLRFINDLDERRATQSFTSIYYPSFTGSFIDTYFEMEMYEEVIALLDAGSPPGDVFHGAMPMIMIIVFPSYYVTWLLIKLMLLFRMVNHYSDELALFDRLCKKATCFYRLGDISKANDIFCECEKAYLHLTNPPRHIKIQFIILQADILIGNGEYDRLPELMNEFNRSLSKFRIKTRKQLPLQITHSLFLPEIKYDIHVGNRKEALSKLDVAINNPYYDLYTKKQIKALHQELSQQ